MLGFSFPDGNLLAWLIKLLFVGIAARPAEPPWELHPPQADGVNSLWDSCSSEAPKPPSPHFPCWVLPGPSPGCSLINFADP